MPPLTVAECGERALIARITARLTSPSWVIVGPGDDAAVVEPVPRELEVLTTDAQIDGVHFDRRFTPPEAIGHRALAVNLSDLAAMGARPRAALLSLALPSALELTAFDAIIDGLLALAAHYGTSVIGGNITSTPGPLTLDVTAIGSAHRRQILTRAGARPGDEVFVTGTLGNAAAGLLRLQAGNTDTAAPGWAAQTGRFLRPDPRIRAGLLLARNRAANSCVDLSDGLADGVRQIAQASSVGVALDAASLPIAPELRTWTEQNGRDPLALALTGGDDFELLFTARPRQSGRLRAVRRHLGDLPITRIGVVTKAPDLLIMDGHGRRELPAGYEHFR